MAENIVYPPQATEMDWDYIAFTFKGKHSYEDFGIVRVSDGDRYTQNLTPNLSDKTAEADGSDGMYFLGTQHRQKEFQISFAFDRLTEAKLRGLKQWLGSKEPGDLWFAEEPYKVYTAKVTGTPSIKYILFDDYDEQGNIIRVYKGEGNVTFTAYWPYAHTPDFVESNMFYCPTNANYVTINIPKQQIQTNWLWVIRESGDYVHNYLHGYLDDVEQFNASNDSGSVNDDGFFYLSNKGSYINKLIFDYSLTKGGLSFYFGDKERYDPNKPLLVYSDGRNAGTYSPFTNSQEFIPASGLTNEPTCQGENPGDLPAPFILSKSGTTNANTTFTITDKVYIKTLTTVYDLKWDSKMGIVSGLSSASAEESTRAPVPVEGNTVGGIPVGGCQPEINGATLTYRYWYY